MLHLFNNVFIEQDKFINLIEAPDIVIASAEYKTDPINASDNVSNAGLDMSEILGDSTYAQWFADLIAKTTKVVIYADNSCFAEIVGTWLKSTTNMDNSSYNMFIDCYDYKIKTESKQNDALTTALKSAWSSVSAVNVSADFKPSFEFLMASHLHDANFAKKEKLVSIMSSFLKRYYEEQILEARKKIDHYILNDNMQTALGGSDKTLGNINALPKMSVFSGSYWNDGQTTVPSKSYQPGANSKIDISKATTEQLSALVAVVKEVNLAIINDAESNIADSVKEDAIGAFDYIDTVKSGNLSNEQYSTVMGAMTSGSIDIKYIPAELEETIVTVFLSHLSKLNNTSDTSALQKFTLK
jgi:hypothetical protein